MLAVTISHEMVEGMKQKLNRSLSSKVSLKIIINVDVKLIQDTMSNNSY